MGISSTQPVASYKSRYTESVMYPDLVTEDLVRHVFLHLDLDGEHTTLVLEPHEFKAITQELTDACRVLFPAHQRGEVSQ